MDFIHICVLPPSAPLEGKTGSMYVCMGYGEGGRGAGRYVALLYTRGLAGGRGRAKLAERASES